MLSAIVSKKFYINTGWWIPWWITSDLLNDIQINAFQSEGLKDFIRKAILKIALNLSLELKKLTSFEKNSLITELLHSFLWKTIFCQQCMHDIIDANSNKTGLLHFQSFSIQQIIKSVPFHSFSVYTK